MFLIELSLSLSLSLSDVDTLAGGGTVTFKLKFIFKARKVSRGSVTDYFFIKCVIHGLVTGAYRPSPLHMDTDTDQTQTYHTYWEGETAEGGGMKKGCVETG